MIIELSNQTLPGDPQVYVESERNRAARKKQLNVAFRACGVAAKRAARLDKYFSSHPPNGKLIDIFRACQQSFRHNSCRLKEYHNQPPAWLEWPDMLASFERLQKKGILTLETTEDKMGAKLFKSESKMKQRNIRPVEIDALIDQLKKDLGDSLQQPPVSPDDVPQVHGCRQVTLDKWRVRLYVGGAMRALGCYPFETAVRLQDALAYYFSSYRRPVRYNTSEAEARQLLLQHPAVLTFCTVLETLWLSAGILVKPGETPLDKAEQRWQAIESRLTALEEPHLKITP